MFDSKKKDAAFFEAFSAHAQKSVEAAKLLHQMMQHMRKAEPGDGPYRFSAAPGCAPGVDSETKRLAAAINELEKGGDTITHQTVKRLHENWITPLDRDDIHGLIGRMDDVLDLIDAASERVVLFQVCVAASEATGVTELLVKACEAMAQAIGLLEKMAQAPAILELCVEVNRLENATDVLYRKALSELFQPGNDPLMVMKWRDIFDSLETAVDRCEDVANIIEGIVLEYA